MCAFDQLTQISTRHAVSCVRRATDVVRAERSEPRQLDGNSELRCSQRHPKKTRAVARLHSLTFAIVGCFHLLLLGCGTAPDLETSRKFQQAEEAFQAAERSDEFVKVAAMYQEILDNGFVSGSVLYNQGNAWMQAQKRGHAIASYRQARQHLPRDPYLAANLNQALGAQATPKQPLLDYVFFWQKSISYREKGVLATVLLTLVLLLFLIATMKRRSRVVSRIGWLALVAFVLVAISFGRDWYNFEYTRHGVVVVSECTARKGGSATYEPAFNMPLTEGTEFSVIRQQNDWLNVLIPDAGEGWIPQTECVTFPR